MRQITIFAVFLLFSITGYSQELNTEKSYVEFRVGNLWLNTVSGTIKGMEGTVNFDPENVNTSEFDVHIDVRTLDTGNEKRDKDLLSEDFLEVQSYPTIRFKSLSVNNLPSGKYVAVGNLTIKDVTREAILPFVAMEGELIGEMTIDRMDFNVGTDTGTFMVGKEVVVTIVCVLQ